MLPLPLAPALLLLGQPIPAEATIAWASRMAAGAGRAVAIRPAYDRPGRAVTNWRWQTALRLEPGPLALVAALGRDQRTVTRCVKLNNYWCIKRAGWRGEIGFDEEGHVGYASATEGADAAVTLLRRYYLDFGRRSALDVVRRWAPAECGPASVAVARRGLQGTVRARWLATQRGKARGLKAMPGRSSTVALAPLPTFRVPDIAVGMGERPRPSGQPGGALLARSVQHSGTASARQRVASATALPSRAATPAAAKGVPAGCTDEQRIRNYAGRIVRDLVIGPGDDLRLFSPDGTPLPSLATVMIAMSAFELGSLSATSHLVESAIARAAPPPRPAP